MAIVFFDGFDHYGTSAALLTDGQYAQNAGIIITENAGPGGVGHVLSNFGNEVLLRKVLPAARELIGIGQRMYFASLPTGNRGAVICSFRDGGNVRRVEVCVESTGALGVYDAGDVAIYTTDPAITANSWRFVELKLDCTGATPKMSIGVDSITIATDIVLTGFPDFNIAQFSILTVYDGRGRGFWKMRDLYVWDNTGTLNNSGMQGDRQVLTGFPDADGTFDDWVPSIGSFGFPLVNNNPPNDAEFISANLASLKSSFLFDDIDTDITNISAVQVIARVKKSDAGLGTIQLNMLSGADETTGTTKAVSTEFAYYTQIHETDPATDLKWTPLGVNDSQVIIERIE